MCIYKKYIRYTYVYIYKNLGKHVPVVFVCVSEVEREKVGWEKGGEKCMFVDGRDGETGSGDGETGSGYVDLCSCFILVLAQV